MTGDLSRLHLFACIKKELTAFIANEYPQLSNSKMFCMQCFFTLHNEEYNIKFNKNDGCSIIDVFGSS